METGHDILFFWVIRMAMLGLQFTSQLPFKKVLLHGLLLDDQGKKMSKSLGNVIDPMNVIQGITLKELEEQMPEIKAALQKNFPEGITACGADSLRFSLLMNDIKSGVLSLDLKNVQITRNFCNKVWQGTRFFLMFKEKNIGHVQIQTLTKETKGLSPADYWLLSRLSNLIDRCQQNFANFEFQIATLEMRQFWVQDLCDIYLEYVKTLSPEAKYSMKISHDVLATSMTTFYSLIAPIMPFLSEELNHRLNLKLGHEPSSIFECPYPNPKEWAKWSDKQLELDVIQMRLIMSAIRLIKTSNKVPKIQPDVIVEVKDANLLNNLSQLGPLLQSLSKIESLQFVESPPDLSDWKTSVISELITVHVNLEKKLPQECIQSS